MKAEGEEWIFEDEILEDWGNNEEDQKKLPKNKVYFACQKVNTTMQLQIKIDDFLEYNTAKARINPKYKKVV